MAPTPLGAFAVKHLGAAAGIVVTASHNPPQYNGYKVYWQGGNQINEPIDGQIATAIEKVADSADTASPASMPLDEALDKKLLEYLTDDVFQAYQDQLLSSVSSKSLKGKEELIIAYTPMHGVGAPYAEKLLHEAGLLQVHTVKEQREADGDFPTVNFPSESRV